MLVFVFVFCCCCCLFVVVCCCFLLGFLPYIKLDLQGFFYEIYGSDTWCTGLLFIRCQFDTLQTHIMCKINNLQTCIMYRNEVFHQTNVNVMTEIGEVSRRRTFDVLHSGDVIICTWHHDINGSNAFIQWTRKKSPSIKVHITLDIFDWTWRLTKISRVS